MIIIADTSALIALAICDSLYLLDKLYKKVVVPQVVYDECIVDGKAQSQKLKVYLFDKIQQPAKANLVLPSNLGKGELSAMLLYKELKADYLLIDDNRARKIAKYNDINIVGSLGVLLISKEQKLIKKVTPFLEKLEDSNLFISPELISSVKKIAQE